MNKREARDRRGYQKHPVDALEVEQWEREAVWPAMRKTHNLKSQGKVTNHETRSDMIRVMLPFHLRTLAQVDDEVTLDVQGPVTQRSVLDALEARYPVLRGTIRDHGTGKRRPFIRFFACEEDLSHELPDAPLPDEVATGKEPFCVIGAIAGG